MFLTVLLFLAAFTQIFAGKTCNMTLSSGQVVSMNNPERFDELDCEIRGPTEGEAATINAPAKHQAFVARDNAHSMLILSGRLRLVTHGMQDGYVEGGFAQTNELVIAEDADITVEPAPGTAYLQATYGGAFWVNRLATVKGSLKVRMASVTKGGAIYVESGAIHVTQSGSVSIENATAALGVALRSHDLEVYGKVGCRNYHTTATPGCISAETVLLQPGSHLDAQNGSSDAGGTVVGGDYILAAGRINAQDIVASDAGAIIRADRVTNITGEILARRVRAGSGAVAMVDGEMRISGNITAENVTATGAYGSLLWGMPGNISIEGQAFVSGGPGMVARLQGGCIAGSNLRFSGESRTVCGGSESPDGGALYAEKDIHVEDKATVELRKSIAHNKGGALKAEGTVRISDAAEVLILDASAPCGGAVFADNLFADAGVHLRIEDVRTWTDTCHDISASISGASSVNRDCEKCLQSSGKPDCACRDNGSAGAGGFEQCCHPVHVVLNV